MIDARGYSCPMPVVMVQKAVKADAPAAAAPVAEEAAPAAEAAPAEEAKA